MAKKKIEENTPQPPVSSQQSEKDLIVQKVTDVVVEILRPEIKNGFDNMKNALIADIQSLRKEIEVVKGKPQTAQAVDMSSIMKEVGPILNSLGIQIPGGGGGAQPGASIPGQQPPMMSQQNPMGGLGLLQMLPQLLQMAGIGQQQNPMASMMMEYMMRNFFNQMNNQTILMNSLIKKIAGDNVLAANLDQTTQAFMGPALNYGATVGQPPKTT